MNTCETCDAYKQLYILRKYNIWEVEYFYCEVHNKITDCKDSCEEWHKPENTNWILKSGQ